MFGYNRSYPIYAKSLAKGNARYSQDGICIIDNIEVIKTDFNNKSVILYILGRNIKSGKKFQIELKKYDSGRVEKTIKLND